MPSQISIQGARDNFADMVAQTALLGRQFVITKFGRPSAMLVPVTINADEERKAVLKASFGIWKNRKDIKNSAVWVAGLRDKMSRRE